MIKMDDVIREGHPTLRKKAEQVNFPPSKEEEETLRQMLEFLIHSQDEELAEKYGLRPGVGLAAPQINCSKRMIAVRTTDEKGNLIEYALFNPKIRSHSKETTFLEDGEGCLSVDRAVKGIVHRYARITVTGRTLEGEDVKLRLRGFPAIVFQHEIDHLDGIMFYDRIESDDPYKEPLPPQAVVHPNSTDTP
ncbi:peptide deformylase [Texcoconibacillus texcoconensis]|uniref:Peptide deformylase n=1 Tax=Texcoconibacillus texcoconensis TaxID=1095777 RepID=A0A840QLJ4_9BACI|nr:peptide deformylase [Texcoconibacillus texcoconensis]MBB5172244.1 peptide deformylase [Texcoconibacillus texcoconensis]